jgi:putative ATP-dependent endonuclease of the OLD family
MYGSRNILIKYGELMRIESVSVKNLRCIRDGIVHLDPYTCLVGPNGAGKSTVLCALNIFFRQIENAPTDVTSLTLDDFHLQDKDAPIEITVTFSDLNKEAEEDFKGYVRQGKLIISSRAEFDPKTNRAIVKQYGQRLGMSEFKPFFKAHGDNALAGPLKEIFAGLEKKLPELAAKKSKTTKDAMCETLRQFEEDRPDLCELIPSEDQFYGLSKGSNLLQKYVQWVFIPAVKDASDEQSESKSGALGKLLARTVRAQVNFTVTVEKLTATARAEYQKMLDDNQAALTTVSESLGKRLAEWAHPGATLKLMWKQDSTKAVRVDEPLAGIIAGESGFEGDLVRFGHGFQRSYLLALLQELASIDDTNAPVLILGCEEPELYQHPPQAKHLAGVFQKLSEENSQIIVTTHSPYFVTGKNFESVRMVRRDATGKCSSIRQYTLAQFAERHAQVFGEAPKVESAAMTKLQQTLRPALNELFFTQRLILVEGGEDVAYITSWLVLTGRWETYRRSGCHMVPVDGKNELVRPGIVAIGLEIPVLAMADADAGKPNPLEAEKQNLAIARVFGGDENQLFPLAPQWNDRLVLWPADFADSVKREFIVALGVQGAAQFEDMQKRARKECGDSPRIEKNPLYIGHLLAFLKEAGVTSESLDFLCEKLIAFGNSKV